MASLTTNSGWHPTWEENVYGQGRQLNRYPYHAVVGFIFSHFGAVADRSTVRILELGCGAGNNLWFAAREGFSVAGIDGSATAVSYAQKRFAAEALTGDLRVGDFSTLPWGAGEFDLVLDRGSLSQATRRDVVAAALGEAHRVLKPGGRILSLIYSWEHPGRAYGRPLPDGTYTDFSGGYFAGLGTTHFLTRDDITRLYGPYFNLTTVLHTLEEDRRAASQAANAFWKIEGVRVP